MCYTHLSNVLYTAGDLLPTMNQWGWPLWNLSPMQNINVMLSFKAELLYDFWLDQYIGLFLFEANVLA